MFEIFLICNCQLKFCWLADIECRLFFLQKRNFISLSKDPVVLTWMLAILIMLFLNRIFENLTNHVGYIIHIYIRRQTLEIFIIYSRILIVNVLSYFSLCEKNSLWKANNECWILLPHLLLIFPVISLFVKLFFLL